MSCTIWVRLSPTYWLCSKRVGRVMAPTLGEPTPDDLRPSGLRSDRPDGFQVFTSDGQHLDHVLVSQIPT